MSNDKIVERIKKLLELGKSTNEHEAAAAAAKATALMEQYRISEAVLAATDDRASEEVVEETVDGNRTSGKRVAWKCAIVGAAARATGCSATWTIGGAMRTIGHTSAVQTWSYLCQYLFREVNRLADEAWDAFPTTPDRADDRNCRPWKNAFRLGAAHVISARLREQAREQDRARGAAVDAAAPDPGAATTALAIINKGQAEVTAAYERKTAHFARGASIGQISSGSGYQSGRVAGKDVNLSGGGRGLPAPAKALRR